MDNRESVTRAQVCRVCGGRLEQILDFGMMPLANRYLAKEQLGEPEFLAPLEVMACQDCSAVQLHHTVDPKILFGGDYLYASSTSGTLAKHFQDYAVTTAAKLRLEPGRDFIVGVGGNDGPLERAYLDLGFNVLNVEPAANIAQLSRQNGVETLQSFFTEDAAAIIKSGWGEASLITCNNCFAHIPDIHGVVRAIKRLLKPGGVFVFENAYWLEEVRHLAFDHIYHEHCFYWTLRPLVRLFAMHGMTLYDVEFNDSQGGSLRGFAVNSDSAGTVDYSDEPLLTMLDYTKFGESIARWQERCMRGIPNGASVCAYGVPAKFTMLGKLLDWTPDRIWYAVDDSPVKVGRYTPGSHIPIVGRQHFIEHPTDFAIITAANYASLIVERNHQYCGQWLNLFP